MGLAGRAAAVHLALVWLAVAFGLQLGGRLVSALYARHGDPPLAEVLRALPPNSPSLLQIDLGASPRAPRRPETRRVATPSAWTTRAPFLIVFVDGERVGFTRRRPPGEASAAPQAFYVPVSGKEVELAIACPAGPCRSATAVVEGGDLRAAIARLRAPRHPALLAGAAAFWGAFVALLVAARRHWSGQAWGAASAVAALMLSVWLREDLASDPRVADPALACEVVFLGLAVAAARWGVERWGPVLAGAAAATLLVPLALTDRTYLTDWANHLYYAARQGDALRELLRPSYFLHSDVTGAFYPYYAFYGGTAYAATGLLGVLTGSSVFAYRASYAAGLLAAYGGTAWLGRLAGLASWRAHLPALVLVSSAYYLTNPYGRGAWGEFLATSAIPLVAAATVSLLKGAGPRSSGLALFAGAAAFSGSHTITLVWGGVFLVLVGAVTVAAQPAWLRAATREPARLVRAALLFATGIGVNAWFLAPLAAFGRLTDIARHAPEAFGTHGVGLARAGVLLHPGREVPSGVGDGLYVQLPVYALLWAAAACALRFRHLEASQRRLCVGLWAVLSSFLWLITADRHDAVWRLAPEALRAIQFQFRLHGYAALAAAGLVVVGLVGLSGSRRVGRWHAALVAAVLLQLVLAQYQVWSAPRYVPVADVADAGTAAPRSLQAPQDYRFTGPAREGERVFEPERRLHVDPASVRGEHVAIEVPGGGAGLVALNVPASPFVRVARGGRIAGRTPEGWTVVALEATSGDRPRRLEIIGTTPRPARLGVAVSLAALVLAPILILVPGGRGGPSRSALPPTP